MKRWPVAVTATSMLVLLLLTFSVLQVQTPVNEVSVLPTTMTYNDTVTVKPTAPPPRLARLPNADAVFSSLFSERNFSDEVQTSLQTWHLINYAPGLSDALETLREAQVVWEKLVDSVMNESSAKNGNKKQCPFFLSRMEAAGKLMIPCGLIQGSAITVIGIPVAPSGEFQIELVGEPAPGKSQQPVMFHFNVRLQGDRSTKDPVIVQNTWTVSDSWGEEVRCPAPEEQTKKKVDDLDQCDSKIGTEITRRSMKSESSAEKERYFPFKKDYLSVMTISVGEEGFQMTVGGKHVTSFAYREGLEQWLVSEVRVSGDIKILSVLASGLPTSEDLEHVGDMDKLRSDPLPPQKPLALFIGVFSTANNFERRMAIRRTWMQHQEVKTGNVSVRFFVGLHYNKKVNKELWHEIGTYRDIQLMPFVDYYSLITWKTVGICIFGTQVVAAKYVMKTDDDSFVRVSEVLASLDRAKLPRGLLYGLINSDSRPHRSSGSKWYISPEEWSERNYPPWANGPGYVVSHDIANFISTRHKEGRLRMFKLEDVAMGIWISEMKEVEGLQVSYINESRVYNEGCRDGYVVAHYQSPKRMLCLWRKLQEEKAPKCCADR